MHRKILIRSAGESGGQGKAGGWDVTPCRLSPRYAEITASTESADVAVSDSATLPGGMLPLGTVPWSNPGDGSGVQSIVPAVPSSSGVADVFAFQNDGTVAAITSAARPWYFKLVWQNNCATNPWPCGFVLYPDDPQELDNLAVTVTPSDIATIKSAALAAFKKAYDSFPANVVDVSEGAANTGDNLAYVVDGYRPQGGELCGVTADGALHDSLVYYRKNMEEAQWALPIVLQTAQDVQKALGRTDLMKAIGTGIGNNAAHEVAHQFLLGGYGMDDSSTSTYNGSAGCDPLTAGGYFYGFGPISWETITANALQKILGGGWHSR